MVHVSWLVKGCRVSGGSSYQPHFYNINTLPGFLGDHQIQARVGFKGKRHSDYQPSLVKLFIPSVLQLLCLQGYSQLLQT